MKDDANDDVGEKAAVAPTTKNIVDIDEMPAGVRSDVLRKWRDKIRLTIDDQGYVKAGWGYPQSVPEIGPLVQTRLREGDANLGETIAELRDLDPD